MENFSMGKMTPINKSSIPPFFHQYAIGHTDVDPYLKIFIYDSPLFGVIKVGSKSREILPEYFLGNLRRLKAIGRHAHHTARIPFPLSDSLSCRFLQNHETDPLFKLQDSVGQCGAGYHSLRPTLWG
ncbi:MAG: hypothetical protein U5L96_18050 [Owenweeksia sp.]|nr:hypothetical protein [Owenweeksia sp.]